MMRIFRNKKAQNTAEYAILIALVIAAAMAIQVYVKRGLQGRVRDAAILYGEVKGEGAWPAQSYQYEPYYLESQFTTGQDSKQDLQELDEGGWQRDVDQDETRRDGYQTNTAPEEGV